MTNVQFDKYDFRYDEKEGRKTIYDVVRKKFVVLTPEEWVRQHIIHYLIYNLGFSAALMAVERKVVVNEMTKRFDIVVFSNSGTPLVIVECKAPEESISENTYLQIANYHRTLKVPYWWVSNGVANYFFSVADTPKLFKTVPRFEELFQQTDKE